MEGHRRKRFSFSCHTGKLKKSPSKEDAFFETRKP
jgi:hypothetical protein